MATKTKVDNTAIRAFYDEVQEVVSRWNSARHDGGGELKVSLEPVDKQGEELVIRIDAEPYVTSGPGRMTLLQIWFDPNSSEMMGKTPGLPVDNTEPITIDRIQQTLKSFNP